MLRLGPSLLVSPSPCCFCLVPSGAWGVGICCSCSSWLSHNGTDFHDLLSQPYGGPNVFSPVYNTFNFMRSCFRPVWMSCMAARMTFWMNNILNPRRSLCTGTQCHHLPSPPAFYSSLGRISCLHIQIGSWLLFWWCIVSLSGVLFAGLHQQVGHDRRSSWVFSFSLLRVYCSHPTSSHR